LEEREVVGHVLGPRGDHAITRPERDRVERHVPRPGRVLYEGDLVRPGSDQRGDRRVEVGDAVRGLGRRLVSADGGLALEVTGHRLDDWTGWQARPGAVEVQDGGNAGRVGPQAGNVEHQPRNCSQTSSHAWVVRVSDSTSMRSSLPWKRPAIAPAVSARGKRPNP